MHYLLLCLEAEDTILPTEKFADFRPSDPLLRSQNKLSWKISSDNGLCVPFNKFPTPQLKISDGTHNELWSPPTFRLKQRS